jgi:hypothetical protein
MKQLMMVATITLGAASSAFAANGTWTGRISDSPCGASHAAMKAQHKDAKMTDAQCVEACVKGGGKYVFVSGGKVYTLANQDDKSLAVNAGKTVRITGDMEGTTVTASKIALSTKK